MSFSARRYVHRLYVKTGSWRAVSNTLGYSPAYWMLVARGDRRISRDAEDALRRLLRLPPKHFRRIERMHVADLARYIRKRRVWL